MQSFDESNGWWFWAKFYNQTNLFWHHLYCFLSLPWCYLRRLFLGILCHEFLQNLRWVISFFKGVRQTVTDFPYISLKIFKLYQILEIHWCLNSDYKLHNCISTCYCFKGIHDLDWIFLTNIQTFSEKTNNVFHLFFSYVGEHLLYVIFIWNFYCNTNAKCESMLFFCNQKYHQRIVTFPLYILIEYLQELLITCIQSLNM